MRINKTELHQKIEQQLIMLLTSTSEAAIQARATATDEENKAENKYDTLGLEAAYLAEGQSKRVAEFEQNLHIFRNLKVTEFDENSSIKIGALISLISNKNDNKYVFLSPVSGGIEFTYENIKIMLITELSPLGKALKGKYVGDELKLKQAEHEISYDISDIW